MRKLITLGASYAVTIPAAWVKLHAARHRDYVVLTTTKDGNLQICPLDPTAHQIFTDPPASP